MSKVAGTRAECSGKAHGEQQGNAVETCVDCSRDGRVVMKEYAPVSPVPVPPAPMFNPSDPSALWDLSRNVFGVAIKLTGVDLITFMLLG